MFAPEFDSPAIEGRHKIAPRRGSMISAGIRPQGILYKLPFF